MTGMFELARGEFEVSHVDIVDSHLPTLYLPHALSTFLLTHP